MDPGRGPNHRPIRSRLDSPSAFTARQPQTTRESAVLDALEAIDAIPEGDQLVEVTVWQFAPDAVKDGGQWAWYVRMEHEVGPGSSGKGDGKTNRRMAKMLLIRGDNRWPLR